MLDYFLQKLLNSKIKNYKRQHSFSTFEKIKNVLILFDMDQWAEIEPIILDLKKSGKNVKAWTIRAKDAPSKHFPNNVRVIEPEEINWLKLLKKEVTSEFDNLEYDTLIDLTTEGNDYLLLLFLRNKSKFCIGFQSSDHKFYDFVLRKQEEQTFEEAFFDLKNYLERIQ